MLDYPRSHLFKRMKKRNLILVILSITLLTSPANALVMHFERGGASTVPGLVKPGQVNLEIGTFNYADEFNGKGSYGLTLASTKVRIGITDRFELRLTDLGVLVTDDLAGFSNLGLGFKLGLLNEEHGILPVVNLVTEFQIPAGREELRNPGFAHSYLLTTSKSLTDRLIAVNLMSLNFGSTQNSAGEKIGTVGIFYLTNLGYAINDKLGIFTDLYGTWGLTNGLSNPLAMDFGFAYAITDNFIYDLSVNWGLNESAPDFGVDTGLAFRLH